MSLGGFDPPPPTLKLSVRSHYATMTRLIRPIRFSIAYRLVANSLFFCALEAVVRTLVQMDSISYALTIELNAPLTHHTHYTPKIFLFITHSLYFGGLGNMSLHDRAPFFILLMDLEINLFCNTINNGFCIIRADNFHTTNMVYLYQEMGGTLSHRSFSKNIIWTMHINIFIFICSIYLFIVFWGTWRETFFQLFKNILWTMHINFFIFFVPYILCLFFWGTWREIFMNGFVYFLNKPPCGRLYGPFGTGRGRRPRSLKQPLDKVFYLNHA